MIDLAELRGKHDQALAEGRLIVLTPRALAQVIAEIEAARREQILALEGGI